MLALQERTQGGVPAGHPVVLRLVEHAGELLAKHLVAMMAARHSSGSSANRGGATATSSAN
eukprot:292066-Alexandrium_andersonii.AAC.1